MNALATQTQPLKMSPVSLRALTTICRRPGILGSSLTKAQRTHTEFLSCAGLIRWHERDGWEITDAGRDYLASK